MKGTQAAVSGYGATLAGILCKLPCSCLVSNRNLRHALAELEFLCKHREAGWLHRTNLILTGWPINDEDLINIAGCE
jgi:hypothetical protein